MYPIKECLEICKKEKADMALAVLHQRNGDYLLAINSYLTIIDNKLDLLQLMKELSLIMKQQNIPNPIQ